jgi:hypothetical protein
MAKKQKARSAGIRALNGMRVHYPLRPMARSSSSKLVMFMGHSISQALHQLCKPFSSGSSVDVLITLVCTPVDFR